MCETRGQESRVKRGYYNRWALEEMRDGLAVLWRQIRSGESSCGGVGVKRGGIKDGG